ncbi:histidine kinase N-terminal 7TM domain-containing diguanylate cyclase [Anaerotalea alkaliphila]|uniref:Diguanylate cyclase n=1 Tax=Anaerotalea alkaliphila TaxID=2662126 RepID=A0A7X5KNS0_9FIRM|nr:diguanylate cyclase [Anaerotalea alkaliphila]NDL67022.1 diguanylate cyclase [Anaerotalea alkaliphila]
MLRTAITLYLFSTVLATAFFTSYVLVTSRARYRKYLSAMVFSLCLYLFGYLMELQSTDLDRMYFWNQVQYFGLPFYPSLWLAVVLFYARRIKTLGRPLLAVLFFVPAFTFLLRLTNPLHHLYYRSIHISGSGEFPLLHLQKGPWYYVQSLHALVCMLAACWILYRLFMQSGNSPTDRLRLLLHLNASLLPFLGLGLILVDFGGNGLDYGALLAPVSLSIMIYTVFRFDFLELLSLARESIFENSRDAMLVLDNDLRILDHNKEAEALLSPDQGALLNRPLQDAIRTRPDLASRFTEDSPWSFLLDNQGLDKWYEVTTSPLKNHMGRSVGILKNIRDVTDRKKLEQELQKLATIDGLSGLYNRRRFMEVAQMEFLRTKRSQKAFSILMVDLDHFKRINDTYGHGAGDEVIRAMGRLLRNTFRKTDSCGRLGGEEFAVLLPDTGSADAFHVAEIFRKETARTLIPYGDRTLAVTASIGVATFSGSPQDLDNLLQQADEALYTSKVQGRNKTTGAFR